MVTLQNLTASLASLALQKRNAPPLPPFLRVPQEIRDLIYDYILGDIVLSRIDFRHVEFKAFNVYDLILVCKCIRHEIYNTLKRSMPLAVRTLATMTLIFPFRPGDWAEGLAATGFCASCRSYDHIRIATMTTPAELQAGNTLAEKALLTDARPRITGLKIYLHPCKCVAARFEYLCRAVDLAYQAGK